MRWYTGIARAQRCLISGPAQEAERLAFAALELGRSAEQPDKHAGVHRPALRCTLPAGVA